MNSAKRLRECAALLQSRALALSSEGLNDIDRASSLALASMAVVFRIAAARRESARSCWRVARVGDGTTGAVQQQPSSVARAETAEPV